MNEPRTPRSDIEKLKSEQGANITYLRVCARQKVNALPPVVADQIERACDDIEAYREIMGFLLKAEVLGLSQEDGERFSQLVQAMTWGNP